MHWIDWTIVIVLNVTVFAVGFALARGTHSSSEWFLGRRMLPWWVIGMSMFATNVDSADLVGVTGTTYKQGVHLITVFALGSTLGGILAAFVIVPAIYRLGFYTNAEYLEARYGPSARVLSALIQLQYRSIMLGLMIWSMFLLLTRLVELRVEYAWMVIVICVICAGIYTAMGGLKSVVWTDALQGVIMIVGAAVIAIAVYNAVGGWSGMTQSLERAGVIDGKKVSELPRLSSYRGKDNITSPWIILLGWTIIGTGYWTVNHTQTMRLLGARSLWDMKMAAIVGVGVSLPVMVACSYLGVFGRAIPEYQNLKDSDALFPLLANRFLGPGLTGLVVAGVVAAVVSTFDSMGSALSAIFTRDVYARLIVRDGSDAHYLMVSRIATVGALTLGFLYLPFIIHQKTMLNALTTLIPVFVTPLMTIYVVGVIAPVHHHSGLTGLVVGSLYGVIALIDREFYNVNWLPETITNRWIAFSLSVIVTTMTMAITTLIFGRDDGARLRNFRETGWLERSREELPRLREHPFETAPTGLRNPTLWALALFAFCLWLELFLLW